MRHFSTAALEWALLDRDHDTAVYIVLEALRFTWHDHEARKVLGRMRIHLAKRYLEETRRLTVEHCI